jgi:hypothetical protein
MVTRPRLERDSGSQLSLLVLQLSAVPEPRPNPITNHQSLVTSHQSPLTSHLFPCA